MRYIPITAADKAAMLRDIGVGSTEELFAANIPADVRLARPLNLPAPLTEMEILAHVRELTKENINLQDYACFLGAGAYDHYIPSVIETFLRRGEFLSAYTPYQPEISQGVLQVIYEYQSLFCALTGMDLSNASMYDGASAMAEAAGMVVSQTGRRKVVVAKSVHPNYRRVLQTYMHGIGVEVIEAPITNGQIDLTVLELLVTEEVAGVIVQMPNFLGNLEDVRALDRLIHAKGAMYVVAVDPLSLGILEAPANYGADIVVAEGQGLGNYVSYGGPYLGMMATREKLSRKIPGRIVGATVDSRGQRSFVLTLQAREQHIRREKATSNICTNQALMAMVATVYLTLIGKEGLKEVGTLCLQKAHYAAREIAKLPGYSLASTAPFFKEFTVSCPQPADQINKVLLGKKMIGGFASSVDYPEIANAMTIAVTEKRTKAEIDTLVAALAEVK
jgi:glycine dehydrogenase subunit 1